MGSNPTLSEGITHDAGHRPAFVVSGLDAARTAGAYYMVMERNEHRFMVRVWLETAAGTSGQWRGVVDHIGTGRKVYFSDMTDLMDFIRLRMTETSQSSSADEAKT